MIYPCNINIVSVDWSWQEYSHAHTLLLGEHAPGRLGISLTFFLVLQKAAWKSCKSISSHIQEKYLWNDSHVCLMCTV